MLKTVLIVLMMLSYRAYADTGSGFQLSEGNLTLDLRETWKTLSDFFDDNMPQKIIINRKDFQDGNSKFNCPTNTVFINSKNTDIRKINSLIAHESTHIILCQLTQSYNVIEKSRFWDEGLATIMQYRNQGLETDYKRRSHELARHQDSLGNLKFSKIQSWHSYSRDEKGKINGYAYGVGSSFDYFLIDTFGELKFKKFLSDLGKIKDFDTGVKTAFNKSSQDLEEMWRAYLKKNH